MNVWYVPLAVAVVFMLVGVPLVIWQVLRAATGGTTEVELLGIKVKSPYVGLVLAIVGIGVMWFSAEKLSEEGRLQIVDATVSVDGRFGPSALYWHTPCPQTVEVAGQITGTGRGTATYRFVHQIGLDGQETPIEGRAVDIVDTTTVPVVDHVVVPFPEGEYYYSIVLEVIGPTELRSAPVGFTVWCDPNTEPAPAGMPPPPVVEPPPG